jgi:HNH endonuclease
MNIRPCERLCQTCRQWKHHSRFHLKTGNSTDARFSPTCRDCEQKERNERKNEDRPIAIMRQRAATAARKAKVSVDFYWTQMNYAAFVPVLRAMMTAEGKCIGCGHPFLNERDIQIEHLEPPRKEIHPDWARLHARNLRLACGSCNRTKGQKPFNQWLDEQEGARLSNLKEPTQKPPEQPPLF